jgi:cytochrome c
MRSAEEKSGMPRPSPSRPHLALRAAVLLLGSCGLAACGGDAGEPAALQPAGGRADLALGQRLITQYQCGSCHAIPDVPAARGLNGPSLQAFGKRSYIAGRVPNSPEALAHWLVAPASLVPDTLMPSMGVTPTEARHMAAYLGQLE